MIRVQTHLLQGQASHGVMVPQPIVVRCQPVMHVTLCPLDRGEKPKTDALDGLGVNKFILVTECDQLVDAAHYDALGTKRNTLPALGSSSGDDPVGFRLIAGSVRS